MENGEHVVLHYYSTYAKVLRNSHMPAPSTLAPAILVQGLLRGKARCD